MTTELLDDIERALAITDPEDATIPVDADHANRLVRLVGYRRRRLAEAEELASREIARVEAWLQEQRARWSTADLELMLAGWHRAVLADGGPKTVSLPNGKLVARTPPARWVFDDDLFLDWAATNLPEAVRVKAEVDKPTAKQLIGALADGTAVVGDTGEQVPGVRIEAAETTFRVETATGEEW